MTTYNIYNTYQEAKIANPKYAIFEYLGKFGTDKDIIDTFDINSVEMKECNPADYCITVEQFLKDGHKFAIGDYALDEFGFVIHLTCSTKSWSKKDSVDSYRYVLRAKALEQPKQVNWKNGDYCFYNDNEYMYVGKFDCKWSSEDDTDRCVIVNPTLRPSMICAHEKYLEKPESPEEKEQRERLEAAYDLYCVAVKANQDKVNSFDHFLSHKYKSAWLAVVDKANYRKGGE